MSKPEERFPTAELPDELFYDETIRGLAKIAYWHIWQCRGFVNPYQLAEKLNIAVLDDCDTTWCEAWRVLLDLLQTGWLSLPGDGIHSEQSVRFIVNGVQR